MLTYLVILGLGIWFLYSLRDFLLEIQNRRDAKSNATSSIITHNEELCKQFKKAG